MTEITNLIAPHLNSDQYKLFLGSTDTLPYLEYIKIRSDGTFLIGCSELVGRHWKGCVYVFKSKTDINDVKFNPKRAIRLASSTTDSCFLGKTDKILTCDDSGAVTLWSRRQFAPYNWVDDAAVYEHDDIVMAMDCLSPEETYVTVGADGHIKIWDVQEMLCIRNYELAHSNIITDVSVKPNSSCVMATSSYDRTVCLWDENINKPVLDVAESDCGIRCVKWLDEQTIVFGNEAGALCSVDIRQPLTTLNTIDNLPAALHKITVKHESKHVAVCGDYRRVSVYDISGAKSQLIYKNNELHKNFIRGLAWDIQKADTLYSVGWDQTVKAHNYQ